MVNEKDLQLLSHLKASQQPISGQKMAQSLGLSRVALHKRIEHLRQAGYTITAGRRGYCLVDHDRILPWEFPGLEDQTQYFQTLDSTMDVALTQALAGQPAGFLVAAEQQSAGRGQAGKQWASPEGNLHVTIVTRPKLPLSHLGSVSLQALYLLGQTITELYGLPLTLKWPNDLLAGSAKVAGVLVEACGTAETVRFFNVGIGLNVHAQPNLERSVASLEGLTGQRIDRRAIVSRFRSRLLAWCLDPALEPRLWAQTAAPPTPWRVETRDGQVIQGLFSGFERDGSLLLTREQQIYTVRMGNALRLEGV